MPLPKSGISSGYSASRIHTFQGFALGRVETLANSVVVIPEKALVHSDSFRTLLAVQLHQRFGVFERVKVDGTRMAIVGLRLRDFDERIGVQVRWLHHYLAQQIVVGMKPVVPVVPVVLADRQMRPVVEGRQEGMDCS
jgi:hypothetical protein